MRNLTVNLNRINELSEALASLGFEGIIRFDLYEPEYHALKNIYLSGVEPKYLSLTGVLAGISDYQLGYGGAEVYWNTLESTFKKFGVISSLGQVEILMKAFLSEPINARFRNTKIQRINKLFKSNFCRWLVENYDKLLADPVEVWKRLATDLGSGMYKKTIVFAMKVYDLVNLIVNNEYLPFPRDIPIPVDFHIRNMAISSGIVEYSTDDEVRHAWNLVSEKVSSLLNKNVNPLRIDSIIWQLGKIAYKNRLNRDDIPNAILNYLRKLDIPDKTARIITNEFTRCLDKALSGCT